MKTKVTFFIIFLTTVVGNTMAQDANQEYTDAMNAIFQQIDKSQIPTGLLVDYGVQIVDPEAFNGIPSDSNYVDMDTWKMLYSGIYSSKINNNVSLSLPEAAFGPINSIPSNISLVAMMHYQYNKLNDNAVSLGLLKVVNNQLVPVAGAASPYLTKQLFAVAPRSLYFDTSTASFVFMQATWFSNSGKTVQKLEINFNNESGYKVATWNTAVSYTFSSEGQKTIYFRLTYTDGSSYTSHTNVIVGPVTSSFRTGSYSNIDSVSIAASSLHSGGKIQISYASSNTSGQLKKPLIVAEGFDAYGIMPGLPNSDIHGFLKLKNIDNDYGTINLNYSGGNLLNNIDLSQYDIVYLDYNNGTDDIRRNAKLFEEVINWVNTHKTGGQPNVVMGLSMGGLVARYALRDMEVAGKDHQTWKFISVDAPHKGANVPVSVQAAVRHLEDLDLKVFFVKLLSATDISSDLKGAINLLNSKAAKQMLIYQITKDLAYDNSEYTAFMQEYDALGFPQQCQNIAITDGNGQGTTIFAPESGLIAMNESYTLKWWQEALNILLGRLSGIALATNYPQLVINAIPGKTQVYASVFANAIPNKKVSKIYEGRVYYKKTILWLIPVSVDITKKSLNSTSDMIPIDGAPGGKYDINAMMNLSGNMSQYILQKQFCFVPTVSALGLLNWKDKLNSNLQNEDFYATGTSDFDQYYTPATNELHTRLNSSAQFLYTHLTCPMFYFSPNVSTFCGTNSSVIKNPSNYALTWSVSPGFTIQSYNNTGAAIASPVSLQTGILTCKNNNTTIVRKRLYSTCNFNVTISGSSIICPYSSETYTLEGKPNNDPVTWSCDNVFSLVSTQGNNATFNTTSTTIGGATIKASFSGVSVSKVVYVIQNPSTEVHNATMVYTNNLFTIAPPTRDDIISYRWTVQPTAGAVPSNTNGLSLDIKFTQTGSYSINAYGKNKCCESSIPTHVYIYIVQSSTYYSVYPNPVRDLLNIEPEQSSQQLESIAGMETSTSTETNELTASNSQLDIYLYDINGNLKQQKKVKKGKVQMNVSNLQKGIYYLHIYDEGSKTPAIQQIVVKQ